MIAGLSQIKPLRRVNCVMPWSLRDGIIPLSAFPTDNASEFAGFFLRAICRLCQNQAEKLCILFFKSLSV